MTTTQFVLLCICTVGTVINTVILVGVAIIVTDVGNRLARKGSI